MSPTPFFEQMRPRLIGYFQRHGAGGESNDLAQESLTRVWESFFHSQDEANLQAAFAYAVAKRVLQEFLRRQHRAYQLDPDRPEPVDPYTEMPNPEAGNPVLDRIIQDEEKRRFQTCCTRLKPEDRQLWDEYHYRSPEERKTLARDLGISTNYLRVRIHYIADKLRKCLKAVPATG